MPAGTLPKMTAAGKFPALPIVAVYVTPAALPDPRLANWKLALTGVPVTADAGALTAVATSVAPMPVETDAVLFAGTSSVPLVEMVAVTRMEPEAGAV